ncbi:MAG: Flp pilus assembly protein CpaB [Gemmatimonadota bacterium]
MQNRVGIILLLALVSGAVAVYLGFTVLRDPAAPRAARAAEGETTPVAVAARDIEAGSPLAPEDVRLIAWPSASVPEGYSSSPSEVVGRGLLTSVKMNEPLLSGKLALKEAGGGLPIVIPEGMRAVSVKVDEVISIAGFVLTGTRVDVLVTLDDRGTANQEPVTQLVLQNIEVKAAGTTYQRDPQGQPQQVTVVTLLVDPEQAEKLTLAATRGRIQLALRNTLDLDTVSTPGARFRNLIRPGQVARAPVRRGPPRRSNRVSVEVYRGPTMETTSVRSEGSEGGGS